MQFSFDVSHGDRKPLVSDGPSSQTQIDLMLPDAAVQRHCRVGVAEARQSELLNEPAKCFRQSRFQLIVSSMPRIFRLA